jgi:hypothetical protein
MAAIEIALRTAPAGEVGNGFAAAELERLRAAPGVRTALLARAADGGPGLLSVREFDTAEAVPAEAPAATTSRLFGERIGDTGTARGSGSHLFLVTFPVPPEDLEEFDAWYREEHVPMLMAHASWLRCRRYRAVSADRGVATRIALHLLADIAVLDSPERDAAAKTAWRQRLAERPWFRGAEFTVWTVSTG